jgi:protein phosphatase PTC2/3
VHHNFDDSDSGYDVDMENKSKPFGIGGYKGRIIFLGDGTEVLTDSDDTEMFDNSEEDKDLASQVSKSGATEKEDESSGPPPKAPSPPPQGAKKEQEASATKTDTSSSNDTPAEVLAEAVKEGSEDGGKQAKGEEASKA